MMKGRMFVVRETIGSSGQMALHCYPMEKLWYLQNAIFSWPTFCYISFQTRNITLLNDIKRFTNRLWITKTTILKVANCMRQKNVG